MRPAGAGSGRLMSAAPSRGPAQAATLRTWRSIPELGPKKGKLRSDWRATSLASRALVAMGVRLISAAEAPLVGVE